MIGAEIESTMVSGPRSASAVDSCHVTLLISFWTTVLDHLWSSQSHRIELTTIIKDELGFGRYEQILSRICATAISKVYEHAADIPYVAKALSSIFTSLSCKSDTRYTDAAFRSMSNSRFPNP